MTQRGTGNTPLPHKKKLLWLLFLSIKKIHKCLPLKACQLSSSWDQWDLLKADAAVFPGPAWVWGPGRWQHLQVPRKGQAGVLSCQLATDRARLLAVMHLFAEMLRERESSSICKAVMNLLDQQVYQMKGLCMDGMSDWVRPKGGCLNWAARKLRFSLSPRSPVMEYASSLLLPSLCFSIGRAI